MRDRAILSCLCFFAGFASLNPPCAAQDPGSTGVSILTWQQDRPTLCAGCVYRSGQNLAETAITYSNINTSTFGQICKADLDGQVYGQPLVVTSVLLHGQTTRKTVVYVVTMNDTVYAIDGSVGTTCSILLQQTLLTNNIPNSPTMSPANCDRLGAGSCQTVAPNIGTLGTPVIVLGGGSGTLYVVAEMQSGTAPNLTYYHFLHALDIKTLNEGIGNENFNAPVQILPTTACPSNPNPFSKYHIQRPALLYGGDGYLYVGFSMMDGNPPPLPNGVIFAYNGTNLSTTPLCLSMSEGLTGVDGAGIWQGGAGPAYGGDNGTSSYVFFSTGNGAYLPNNTPPDYGDSFIKMTRNGSTSLAVSASFTPVDQLNRSGGKDSTGHTCNAGGNSPDDYDFGSGGVMLIPDSELKDPYMGVKGDKESGIFFMDRTTPGGIVPGGYNGDGSCSGTANGGTSYGVGDFNIQTFPIEGSGSTVSINGPVIHTSPAFWENPGTTESNSTNYLYIGSQGTTPPAGELMQYQLCDNGIKKPINSGCSTTGVAASASGTAVEFNFGSTPMVSAASATDTDAIVWAIKADGSDIPSNQAFNWTNLNGQNVPFPQAQKGTLYAFDAVNMTKLYSSNDCTSNLDQINPATKYSVPTVANGHVYVATQGPLCFDKGSGTQNGVPDDPLGCFNAGTLYIFGTPTRSCQ